jgi:hypothetical protein
MPNKAPIAAIQPADVHDFGVRSRSWLESVAFEWRKIAEYFRDSKGFHFLTAAHDAIP